MISPNEKRWIWWFAFLLLGITSIPYLLGYILQGEDWRFTGFVFGVEDGNSYIAKMLWGSTGAWLFRTPYTAFPQNGFFAFIPYMLLGKLTATPSQHEQLVALFQIFRWVGGMAMIWASYQFLALFFDEIRLRRWGVVLVITGGGLGWLSIFGLQDLWFKGLPLEFYSPETFGFLSIYGLPHLSLGRALLIWGLVGYLKGGEVQKVGRIQLVLPGFLWLILGIMQPLTVVTGWAVLAAHLGLMATYGLYGYYKREVFDWKKWRNHVKIAITMIILSSPLVIYTMLSFTFDPFLREWSSQNLIMSPPPGDYLLAFAVILPFVITGLRKMLEEIKPRTLALLGWVLIFPLLAYAPYNLQRRLPDGIWVALVTLGLFGLSIIKSKIWRLASYTWLIWSILSVIILLVGSIFTISQVQSPIFRPAAEVEAFLFLRIQAPENAVVITSYENANPLPAWAPVRVLIGHGPESMRLAQIQPQVEDFIAYRLEPSRQKELLELFDAKYILLGPQEISRGFYKDVDTGIYKLLYQKDGYLILEVQE